MKNLRKLIPNCFKKLVIINCGPEFSDEAADKIFKQTSDKLGVWYNVVCVHASGDKPEFIIG